MADDNHLALRWRARGRYRGGMPGATAAAGADIVFTGTDTLRIVDGRIAEYWGNADSLWFADQLGIGGR